MATLTDELAQLRRQAVDGPRGGLYSAGVFAGLQDLAQRHPELAPLIAERVRFWTQVLTPEVEKPGHWSLHHRPRRGPGDP